jgi:signal transduction histidine kinase
MASNDLTELAGAAARLAREAVQSNAALVLLRGEQDTYRGGQVSAADDLEAWAEELLREGGVAGVVASRGKWAAPINARSTGFHGVIAVSGPAVPEDEARGALTELGRVASTSLARLASSSQQDGSLAETRAALAKGLHDLRTPLNSLRLGMHLLAPGLANQDQAVVDRTHRAIDRMAALVTEMFDSLQKQ